MEHLTHARCRPADRPVRNHRRARVGRYQVDATRNSVRRELDYVRDLGLAEISDLEDGTWHARLTADGVAVVEYVAAAPAGIARPAKGNL